MKRIVVGITGSTGSVYGIRLLEVLGKTEGVETHLVISAPGKRTLVEESAWSVKAVERLAGNHAAELTMSSTKSATGHLLGAAGAIEAIFSILAIRDNVAPPTLNLEAPSRDSVIDRVAKTAQERRIDVALSNSFGFGGTNASVIFRGV